MRLRTDDDIYRARLVYPDQGSYREGERRLPARGHCCSVPTLGGGRLAAVGHPQTGTRGSAGMTGCGKPPPDGSRRVTERGGLAAAGPTSAATQEGAASGARVNDPGDTA